MRDRGTEGWRWGGGAFRGGASGRGTFFLFTMLRSVLWPRNVPFLSFVFCSVE